MARMVKVAAGLGLGLLVAVSAAPSVRAEDSGNADVITAASGPRSPVATITLAQELARLGRTQKDALLLITAAKLTKEVSARDTSREKAPEAETAEPGDAAPDASGPAAGATKAAGLPKTDQDTVRGLLDEARALAGDRKELAALIDEIGKRQTRGAVGGPKRTYDLVNPRTNDVYKITFRDREVAAVGILTDGNPSLSLQILDENKRSICTARYDGSDHLLCQWVPRWRGLFYVRVRNHGRSGAEYVLVTN